MKKKYDMVIKIGSYTNNQGEQKNRYQNIGVILSGEDGPFALLDPGVNLAAYMTPGKDRVLVSLFAPRDNNQQQAPQQAQQGPPVDNVHGAGITGPDDFQDDIPF